MIFRFSVAFSFHCILCILGTLRHSQPQIILLALPFCIFRALHLRLAFTHSAAGIFRALAFSHFAHFACGPIYSRR